MIEKRLLPYSVIITLTLGIYSITLGYSFTYDDYHYVVESDYIKGWRAFLSIFQGDYRLLPPEQVDVTRPLMPFSLMIDYIVWGTNPFGYHLTNIVLHTINSLLMYAFADTLVQSGCRPDLRVYSSHKWVPFGAALLFAAHPIHVEPVAGITFREDLLVATFYLTSILAYIKFRNFKKAYWYLVSILSFILALMSKEMAATLPLVLFVYDYFFLKGKNKVKVSHYIMYSSILISYLLFLYYIYSNLPLPSTFLGSSKVLISTTLDIFAVYVKLLIFPVNTHVDYDLPFSTGPMKLTVFFSIAIIVGSALYIRRSRDRAASFCLVFFFIAVTPVLNVIPTFRLLADRFLYLPSLGFCILLALMLFRAGQKGIRVLLWRTAAIILAFWIMAAYMMLTISKSSVWEDDLTLWSNVLAKSPHSVRAHVAIGTYYLKEGRDDDALAMFLKAIELRPDYDKGHYNLGVAFFRKGDLESAISSIEKAIEINPRYGKAYFNLGLIMAKKGMYDETIAAYEKAVVLMPNNAIAYNNLGNAYSEKGMNDKAIEAYKKAIYIDSGYAEAYYNMGNVFAKFGRYRLALSSYKQAIALNPKNASAYFNMGNAYLALARKEDAVSAYESALKADPIHRGAMDALELIRGADKQ